MYFRTLYVTVNIWPFKISPIINVSTAATLLIGMVSADYGSNRLY